MPDWPRLAAFVASNEVWLDFRPGWRGAHVLAIRCAGWRTTDNGNCVRGDTHSTVWKQKGYILRILYDR
ncbi:hypothetical protein BDZ89DRAFT_1152603 [Hymenopellis radicata]|nr:hypothetical protein BDZ89DRAFT_1152603 [Hymenopellis radicata]